MTRPPRELYDHREQSYVKHLFLTRYLQAGVFKIIQGKSPIFNYVDAFAGPWRVQDDADHFDSSFAQVISILDDVRDAFSGKDINLRIRLCERVTARVELLRNYAARRPHYDIQIFEGRFEDNLDGIASSCKEGFTFTFIDPTGWNFQSSRIFSFLRKINGEFLFNFMSDEINRHVSFDRVAESFGRFLAEENWRERFSAAPINYTNEQKVLYILKQRMREERIATFFPHMTISHPRQNRVRMRLILGTNSPVAVKLFRDTQRHVLQQEMKVRHEITAKESGQPRLFSASDLAQLDMYKVGIENEDTCEAARLKLVSILEESPGIQYKMIVPKLLEDVELRAPELNKLMMQWREEGIIAFRIPPRKRKPQDNTAIYIQQKGS